MALFFTLGVQAPVDAVEGDEEDGDDHAADAVHGLRLQDVCLLLAGGRPVRRAARQLALILREEHLLDALAPVALQLALLGQIVDQHELQQRAEHEDHAGADPDVDGLPADGEESALELL